MYNITGFYRKSLARARSRICICLRIKSSCLHLGLFYTMRTTTSASVGFWTPDLKSIPQYTLLYETMLLSSIVCTVLHIGTYTYTHTHSHTLCDTHIRILDCWPRISKMQIEHQSPTFRRERTAIQNVYETRVYFVICLCLCIAYQERKNSLTQMDFLHLE